MGGERKKLTKWHWIALIGVLAVLVGFFFLINFSSGPFKAARLTFILLTVIVLGYFAYTRL
ncbi:MAG: hypothetical protein ACOCX1_05045 [Fimbriimonadaceae bacterium]